MNLARLRRWRRLAGPGVRLSGAHFALCALVLSILLGICVFSARADRQIVLVSYGDSLSAGLGLSETDSFPAQLEKALFARGHNVRLVNASVSGDTTAAALARFDWSFPDGTDGAIVELGANDALRGLEPEKTRANLDALLARMKAKNVEPLLAGMLAPRNLGVRYTQAFDRIYPELAKKHDILLYPFFLFDVIGKRELSQPDGLHPNAKGVKKIVAQILPTVEKLLARISARHEKTR